MNQLVLASLLALQSFLTPAVAGQLPNGAVPLQSAELRKIYSGKSIIWGNRDGAYFAAIGQVEMVFSNYNDGKDRWTGYGVGSWSVKGNRLCWNVSGAGKSVTTGTVEPFKNHVACWDWYKVGPQYYTRWSQLWRPSSANRNSEYYTQEVSRLRTGNTISGWYAEYRAKVKR